MPFIVFEGSEGTGKTTQLRLLAQWLRDKDYNVIETLEPGDTDLGKEIRKLLLHKRHSPCPKAELLLYAADRAQHVDRVLQPALQKYNTFVLCDRYQDATLAYQGGGRGFSTEWLMELNRFATGGLIPELTILLDATPQIGLQRASKRSELDRMESEKIDFFCDVVERYREIAKAHPNRYLTLDASSTISDLQSAIASEVAKKFAINV